MGGALKWHHAATCCQGKSHIESGAPCQDRVFRRDFGNDITVIALADGAGSASLSHYGAERVIEWAACMMAEKFDDVFARNIGAKRIRTWLASNLQYRLAEYADHGIPIDALDRERLGLPSSDEEPLISCALRDLASTLLLVAVSDNRYIAVHLGDGVIGVELEYPHSGYRLRTLSGPTNGEFANETVFITSSSAQSALRVMRGKLDCRFYSVSGFILMSDGPEASLFRKSTRKLAPACSKMLAGCRTLDEYEMQEQLNTVLSSMIAERTQDDCSIALMAR